MHVPGGDGRITAAKGSKADFVERSTGGTCCGCVDYKKEPQEDRKTLVLAPKTAVLGMGCRKNKSYNEIKQMIKTLVDSREIDLDDIYALASVDVKEKEPGLQELAQHLRVPFVVFCRRTEKSAG